MLPVLEFYANHNLDFEKADINIVSMKTNHTIYSVMQKVKLFSPIQATNALQPSFRQEAKMKKIKNIPVIIMTVLLVIGCTNSTNPQDSLEISDFSELNVEEPDGQSDQ